MFQGTGSIKCNGFAAFQMMQRMQMLWSWCLVTTPRHRCEPPGLLLRLRLPPKPLLPHHHQARISWNVSDAF